MKPDTHKTHFRRTICRLARQALKSLPKHSPAYKEAMLRRVKPMDYLRCAEFPLAYRQLSLMPAMRVLDVASPQWFSLCLAYQHPDIDFYYVNILEDELKQTRETAQFLHIQNIHYIREDCRSLSFVDDFFHRAVSLSAIEHITPDVGGDVLALKEIHRVLKPGGELVLSVPLKETASLVYTDEHPVWERSKQKNNFYMRNYDMSQLDRLAEETNFKLILKMLIFERMGIFAMEYWEGGPGKYHPSKNWVIKLKKKIDKLAGLRLENLLANIYIKLEDEAASGDRLINVVATFSKGRVIAALKAGASCCTHLRDPVARISPFLISMVASFFPAYH